MNARARLADRIAILTIRIFGILLIALLAWIIVYVLTTGW